ncbi:FadR family transcriptional regulator, partial [Candidatus Bipolaricaulota bacterium]|nr:FadR family transcriptional regulator [Candidatus Bipolaricaulota bacterium]
RFVADQILSSIQDGSLKAGERMPSEAKLAELTGVGRTSVREALAALRLMGVVETRVGAGSYVAASVNGEAEVAAANAISEAIAASSEAVQLQEARAVFESGLARLAAARWNDSKADTFTRLLTDMDQAAESESYECYIRLHRDFHLALAQATDNAIVETTERSFLDYMDHEGWKDMERQSYLPNRREYLTESAEEHRAIIAAIEKKNGQEASDLVHKHFSRHSAGDQTKVT